MNDITKQQDVSGIVPNGATPTPSPVKPKRIKHEFKINTEFMTAIESIKKIYGIKKTSEVIEMLFDKKTFSRNVADQTLNDIRSKLNGFQNRSFKIYDYCIEKAQAKDGILQRESIKKYYNLVKTENPNDAKVILFRQFKAIQNQMTTLLTKSTSIVADDSPEIMVIRNTFNGAIDDNLPSRRNLAFRLNEDIDKRYFPSSKPKIGDDEFRRVIHQAMIKNSDFYVERTSREAISHVQDAMKAFNKELKKSNLQMIKGEPIDLHRFFLVVLTLKKSLDKFQIN